MSGCHYRINFQFSSYLRERVGTWVWKQESVINALSNSLSESPRSYARQVLAWFSGKSNPIKNTIFSLSMNAIHSFIQFRICSKIRTKDDESSRIAHRLCNSLWKKMVIYYRSMLLRKQYNSASTSALTKKYSQVKVHVDPMNNANLHKNAAYTIHRTLLNKVNA